MSPLLSGGYLCAVLARARRLLILHRRASGGPGCARDPPAGAGLLRGELDRFGGVSVRLGALDCLDAAAFQRALQASVLQWRSEGRVAVWLHVPILQSALIAPAAALGFRFHHAEADSATLTLWLGQGPSRLPGYATHQVGVAGAVFDENTGKILVVQDQNKLKNMWKLPGGLSEPGEDLGSQNSEISQRRPYRMRDNPPTQRPQFRKRQPVACALFFGEGSIKALPADEDQSRKQRTHLQCIRRTKAQRRKALCPDGEFKCRVFGEGTPACKRGDTAVREVFEETGVRSEFRSLLSLRQQHRHPGAFGKSDMYLICRLQPHSFAIRLCPHECLRGEWVDLAALAADAGATPITRRAARLLLYGHREGFDKVDLTADTLPAVHTGLLYKLYHRELPGRYKALAGAE